MKGCWASSARQSSPGTARGTMRRKGSLTSVVQRRSLCSAKGGRITMARSSSPASTWSIRSMDSPGTSGCGCRARPGGSPPARPAAGPLHRGDGADAQAHGAAIVLRRAQAGELLQQRLGLAQQLLPCRFRWRSGRCARTARSPGGPPAAASGRSPPPGSGRCAPRGGEGARLGHGDEGLELSDHGRVSRGQGRWPHCPCRGRPAGLA
jgi:hypothetical protein